MQLKFYCMGMKQLISLKKYKDACEQDPEQEQLIDRMKSTIGVAVGNMEAAIKAGTIWCPSSQENASEKTPKRKNKVSYNCSSASSNVASARRKIVPSSSEKDDSSNSSEANNEGYTTCESQSKSFCCAGDYCWKEDYPKNLTCICSVCNGKCHEACSRKNKDSNAVTCDRCRLE